MTEIDTGKLREIASSATPGPWFQTGKPWFDSQASVLAGSPDGNVAYFVTDCDVFGREPDEYEGPFQRSNPDVDAAFIAAANPSTVLAMCDEIDRLRAEVERLGNNLIAAEACQELHARDVQDHIIRPRDAEIDRLRALLRRAGEALGMSMLWTDEEYDIAEWRGDARTVAREIEEALK